MEDETVATIVLRVDVRLHHFTTVNISRSLNVLGECGDDLCAIDGEHQGPLLIFYGGESSLDKQLHLALSGLLLANFAVRSYASFISVLQMSGIGVVHLLSHHSLSDHM
ncbi:hypothetical protein CYMTET_38419 [Cymbomonas tetramitiformis]|uniref:Uncharacterized protein n=1 Tax=Cymbomonas tetramitiformis TaxID=36881 RepID=A0AAE0F4Z1_9CHLO|nr:hypothetical protein CYMTET_38419 [Cymbomonas tetramitiformis]